jgi:hypothetical protein
MDLRAARAIEREWAHRERSGEIELQYERAVAIMDAAVEAHENLPALKLAAYLAGREAARVAALDAAMRLGGADTNDGRMALCAVRAIDKMPPPSPEELEKIR